MIDAAIAIGKAVWRYRKLAGYAVAALALAGWLWRVSVWHSGWQDLKAAQAALESAQSEVAKLRKSAAAAEATRLQWYTAEVAAYKASLAAQEARSADLARTLADERVNAEKLRNALSRARLVSRETISGQACPVVRLSPQFRVCANAAVTGASPEIADCEAVRVRAP